MKPDNGDVHACVQMSAAAAFDLLLQRPPVASSVG
jgi:hypothetical protein